MSPDREMVDRIERYWRETGVPRAAIAEMRAELEQHLAQTPHHVLLVAESAGRRESVLELLRDHKLDAPPVDSLAAFLAGDHRYAIAVAPLAGGFHWLEEGVQFVTETELFDSTPSARFGRSTAQLSRRTIRTPI